MRTLAKAVGLDVAKPGCLVNMAVFIAPNKAALLTELERWPFIFPEEWSQSTINELKRDPSPVAAWHTEQFVWMDGSELSAADTGAPGPDPAGGSHLRFPHAVATRIKASARPMFRKSVVVIQADAIAGLMPVELADYATMRSLIRTDPKQLRASSPGTILSIIDAPMGTAIPESLTEWDLAFLKSFYASTKNMYVEYQRAQMKGEMRRELEQAKQ